MTTEICNIAKLYGSDKGPRTHNYTPVYWDLMKDHRNAQKILEIGVLDGASIRIWLDFFPHALVYALDIDRDALLKLQHTPRVYTALGAQQNVETWKDVGDNFDFIIDDGSHVPDDMMSTFEKNFWRVKSHGLWIIEDTHCVFHKEFNPTFGNDLYDWLFTRISAQQMGGWESGDFYKAISTFPNISALTAMIYGIRSYKSMIVFEKA